MKLSGLIKKVAKAIDTEMHVLQQQPKAKAQRAPSPISDGFDVARKSPVNLGRQAPASAAADGEYVKGLYRDLLGREPDPEGFHNHMKGLEAGMSRDSIREVSLNSSESREKQAAAAATPPEAAPAEAPQQPAAYQSVGPVPLEGYDAAKLQDFSHTTVK